MRDSASRTVADRIFEEAYKFDFLELIWQLERHPDNTVNVGEMGPVRRERIRFRPHDGLGFPATDVRNIAKVESPNSDGICAWIDLNFLGLYGVDTSLPLHYSVDIHRGVAADGRPSVKTDGDVADAPDRSTPVRDFLDLFHHRVMSLFYRAALKYRYHKSYAVPGRDSISRQLFRLIGISTEPEKLSLPFQPERLLKYAGLWTMRPASAASMECVLRDYFSEISLSVKSYLPVWSPIPEADQNRMGDATRQNRLGQNFSVGDRIFDISGGFRICLGPLCWSDYVAFLPDGNYFAEMMALVEFHRSDPLKLRVDTTIRAGEVPPAQLGSGPNAARLGYTCWAYTSRAPETVVSLQVSRNGPVSGRPHGHRQVA